jgi:hypothetical protein
MGVIWHGTPTKTTFFSPMRSASARARLFGEYVYQDRQLPIASATLVTTRGFGAAGMSSSDAETMAPSKRPSRSPCARMAVTTPPS